MAIKIKRARTGTFTASKGDVDNASAKTLTDRQMGFEGEYQRLVYCDNAVMVAGASEPSETPRLSHFSADEAIGLFYDNYNHSIAIGKGSATCCGTAFGVNAMSWYRGVAIGRDAYSSSDSVAVGMGSNAVEGNSVAVGHSTYVGQPYSVAVGVQAMISNGFGGVAVGYASHAAQRAAVALGYVSKAYGWDSIAIGNAAYARDFYSVALSTYANAADRAIAIGSYANAQGACSVAIGEQAKAADVAGVALGRYASASNSSVVAIGSCACGFVFSDVVIGDNAFSGGNAISGSAYGSVVLGPYAESHNAQTSVVIGKGAIVSTYSNCIANGIAIGTSAYTNSVGSIAIGKNAGCQGIGTRISVTAPSGGIAIGSGAVAIYQGDGWAGVAIGVDSNASYNGIAIGTNAKTNARGISIGSNADSTNQHSVAIGFYSTALFGAVAIGDSAGACSYTSSVTGGERAVMIGYNARAKANGVALGYEANAAINAIAIGARASATAANTIVLGHSSITALKCQVTSITSLSDERTKENIELANLARCLEIVENLPLKRFSFKKWASPNQIDRMQLGFIAQDVEKVFPKSVMTDEFIDYPELDGEGNVQYEQVYDDDGQPEYEVERIDEEGNKIYRLDDNEKKIPVMKEKTFRLENVKQMNTGQIMMALWGAVQQLTKRIKELEEK